MNTYMHELMIQYLNYKLCILLFVCLVGWLGSMPDIQEDQTCCISNHRGSINTASDQWAIRSSIGRRRGANQRHPFTNFEE